MPPWRRGPAVTPSSAGPLLPPTAAPRRAAPTPPPRRPKVRGKGGGGGGGGEAPRAGLAEEAPSRLPVAVLGIIDVEAQCRPFTTPAPPPLPQARNGDQVKPAAPIPDTRGGDADRPIPTTRDQA